MKGFALQHKKETLYNSHNGCISGFLRDLEEIKKRLLQMKLCHFSVNALLHYCIGYSGRNTVKTDPTFGVLSARICPL